MDSSKIDNYIQFGLLIITLVSIFSPIIVTVLNNRYNYKIKKLETVCKIKQEVLSKFSKNVILMFGSNYLEQDFYESLNMLYIYFEVDDSLIAKIIANDYKDILEFQKDITKLMKALSKQLKYK